MTRPIQDSTADEQQRAALRHFAGRLGLDVDDLRPSDETANVWFALALSEHRELRRRAQALGTSTSVLIRGLVRSWLRQGADV